MSKKDVSRRGYVKYAAAGVVVVGVAAAGGYYATRPPAPTPTPTPTVKPTATPTVKPTPTPTPEEKVTMLYLGGGWTMFPETSEEYSRITNGRVTVTYTLGGIADLTQKALVTTDWHIFNNIDSYWLPILQASPKPTQALDISNFPTLAKTPPEGLWDHMFDPGPGTWFREGAYGVVPPISQWITDEALKRMAEYYWDAGIVPEWDGEKWHDGKPQMVPTCSNQEGIGYLPEYVDFEEQGGKAKTFDYTEKFNKDYKGHVGMQDDPMIHTLWMAVMFTAHKLAELEGFDGTSGYLTKADYDKIIDYDTPYVEGGHITAFAADFGAMVAAMSTREIWIMQCWQPVVMSTRRAMIPCYWAQSPTGGMLWFSGDALSARVNPGTTMYDECLKWMDWRTQPAWVKFILRNGYMCPRWNTQDVKDEMGTELWDWQYGGEYTYKDLGDYEKALEFLTICSA